MSLYVSSTLKYDADSPRLAGPPPLGLLDPPMLRLSKFWAIVIPAAIGVIAYCARLVSLLGMGGFHHLMGYDEGVYFSASTGLLHGLLPYRDFVFVHPPGILLLLSPFAALSDFTSDTAGWTAARLAVMGVGAANAIVVYLIARRVSLVAGIVSGGLYAMWSPAVWVERTTMLEAFVLLGTLVGLWAIRHRNDVTWRLVIGGTALGLASSVKLWGLVPLAVVVAWLLVGRAWKSAAWVAGAAAATIMLVLAPFFAMAPRRMLEMTILGQIHRDGGGAARLARLRLMLNVDIQQLVDHPRPLQLATIVAVVAAVAAVAVCWRRLPITRLWGSLLVAQALVLLSTPVYFSGYSSFTAPALLLIVGSTSGLLWHSLTNHGRGGRMVGAVALVGVIAATTAVSIDRSDVGESMDRAAIAAAAPLIKDATCVGSDSAGILILSNVLTRNLDNGCVAVFDFDGTIYSLNSGQNPGQLSGERRRLASVEYQHLLQAYFAANDAMLMHRGTADGLSAKTRAALQSRPLLLDAPGLKVYGRQVPIQALRTNPGVGDAKDHG